MTLYLFRLLSPQAQVHYALTRGTYLAQHWKNESGINLCHCADDGRDFFVEVGCDKATQAAVVLADYLQEVRLLRLR